VAAILRDGSAGRAKHNGRTPSMLLGMMNLVNIKPVLKIAFVTFGHGRRDFERRSLS
jgi:hypothetical protein